MINYWNCEICGKKRPDKHIAVISYLMKFNSRDVGRFNPTRNLKYCEDNIDCENKAKAKAKKGEL